MRIRAVGPLFEELYCRFNKPALIYPDPLVFAHQYDDPADREVAALVAACLAYGTVKQIHASVAAALGHMGPSPAAYVSTRAPGMMARDFAGFTHRFTSGAELARLLAGVGRVMARHGSLGACFSAGMREDDETVLPALTVFINALGGGSGLKFLLPSPERGSACKRLLLYLRWMVRRDAVDPGCWAGVPAAKLVMPMDTHIHRFARETGITRRASADMKAALDVTAFFRCIAPGDPVRYDFALTRLGMRRNEETRAQRRELVTAVCAAMKDLEKAGAHMRVHSPRPALAARIQR
ncbi:TIGR02757 family protein [bacterium]|nr:TIGR02757 family protein [bacterium]